MQWVPFLVIMIPKIGLLVAAGNMLTGEKDVLNFLLKGGVKEIDIAFFRQLMQANWAKMCFTQKFQQTNHPFSFYGPFYTRFLAHNVLLQEKIA